MELSEKEREGGERERDNSKTADKIALNLCAAPYFALYAEYYKDE